MPLSHDGEAGATVATFPVTGGMRWAVLGDLAEVEDGGSIVVLGADKVAARVEFVPEVVRAPARKADHRWARAVVRAAA